MCVLQARPWRKTDNQQNVMDEREFLDKDVDVYADAMSLSVRSQSVHTRSILEEDYISLSLMEEGEIIDEEDEDDVEDDASHVSEPYSQEADYTEGEYSETDYSGNTSENNRCVVALTFIQVLNNIRVMYLVCAINASSSITIIKFLFPTRRRPYIYIYIYIRKIQLKNMKSTMHIIQSKQ